MSVVHFPVPPETEMTSDELAYHLSGTAGRLLAKLTDAEIDRDCYHASWLSVSRRLEAMQVRRLRLLVVGGTVGAFAGWIVDGTLAQKIDHLLRAVGL